MASSDAEVNIHTIPRDELKAENFTLIRTCQGDYGSAELLEFKGTGGEVSGICWLTLCNKTKR